MKKIAIMTDSNSGITQKEAAGLGISVLPMPFMINDATYFEDINLTQDRFYEFLENDAVVSTSQPSPDSLIHMFHKLLAEYDEVVHIPMSSGLSGSCQTACMLAQEPEFDGKVFVVDNQRISVTQRQSVMDAMELAAAGKSGPDSAGGTPPESERSRPRSLRPGSGAASRGPPAPEWNPADPPETAPN